MSTITFNVNSEGDFIDSGFGEFLSTFNPIIKKYCFKGIDLPIGVMDQIDEFEFSQSYSNLTKSKYSHISDNLDLVYGDNYTTQSDIISYHLAESKIVHSFLGMQNLDRLFDEDYFNFEWDMLVQKNFRDHKLGYYRDHFVHQIRNLYMGDKLLREMSMYDAVKAVLSNKDESKISEYVCKKFMQFKNDEYSPISQLIKKISLYLQDEILCPSTPRTSKLFNPSPSVAHNVFNKIILTAQTEGFIDNDETAKAVSVLKTFHFKDDMCWKDAISQFVAQGGFSSALKKKFDSCFFDQYICKWYAEEYFYNYVIYSSIYLSCLFHDLSYPVCYFLAFKHRLSDYNSATYMFTKNHNEGFDVLANKLSCSLLFTIVSYDEIKTRLEINKKKNEYDHGAYSAIAFLLHFYESGLIHTFSAEKQCAIELAAVAMYDHTLSFDCEEIDINNSHYRPYFNQNPIALLLRLCDDLQEWDRRYFEISGDSDIVYCNKCKTPMLKHSCLSTQFKNKAVYNYMCYCGKSGSVSNSYRPFRLEEFSKRKIFIVRVADSVTAKQIYKNPSDKESPNLLKISVNYDLYRLLLMSRYSYAKYRLSDLKKLKNKLKDQNFAEQSGIKNVPNSIFVDYFMTSNPITIKVKILERWLEAKRIIMPSIVSTGYWKGDIKAFFRSLNRGLKNQFVSLLKKHLNMSGSHKGISNKFYDHIWWYYLVLQICIYCRNKEGLPKDKLPSLCKYSSDFLEKRLPKYDSVLDKIAYCEYTHVLLNDCILQYHKEMIPSENYSDILRFMQSDDYTDQYKSTDEVYEAIMKYCHYEMFFNKDDSNLHFRPDFNNYRLGELPINYYSDLYIFERMNSEI